METAVGAADPLPNVPLVTSSDLAISCNTNLPSETCYFLPLSCAKLIKTRCDLRTRNLISGVQKWHGILWRILFVGAAKSAGTLLAWVKRPRLLVLGMNGGNQPAQGAVHKFGLGRLDWLNAHLENTHTHSNMLRAGGRQCWSSLFT